MCYDRQPDWLRYVPSPHFGMTAEERRALRALDRATGAWVNGGPLPANVLTKRERELLGIDPKDDEKGGA